LLQGLVLIKKYHQLISKNFTGCNSNNFVVNHKTKKVQNSTIHSWYRLFFTKKLRKWIFCFWNWIFTFAEKASQQSVYFALDPEMCKVMLRSPEFKQSNKNY